MEAIKKYKSQLFFHLLLNLIFGIFITLSSYYNLPLNDFKGRFYYLIHFILLQFSIYGYLYFLSINKYIFRFVFPIIFILLSTIAFWVYTQDIVISKSIIQASIETKPDILIDLISFPLFLYILLILIITFFILKLHSRLEINQLKSPLLLLALLSFFSFSIIEKNRTGTFESRLPFNFITALKEYFNQNEIHFKTIKKKPKTTVDSLNIVFILGESVRADHLQLNGYNRKTTPLLAKRNNIISFPNTFTPLTYTAISVPQILTNASIYDKNKTAKYSLIDVLNNSGIQTNWIGNQTPEKSYEVFINQSKFKKILDPLHSELSFQKEYDEKLIPEFKKIYNPHKNQFTLIHMMGSHWWYETRYPKSFSIFKPTIKSKYVPSNTKQEMINSYDNTLLYLDFFIDQIIKKVEQNNSKTIVIYLSDHGELLGENGLWLHAQPGKESENPAMLIWYSDNFYNTHAAYITLLKEKRNQKVNLDFFFPTILDLFKVEGIQYDKSKKL